MQAGKRSGQKKGARALGKTGRAGKEPRKERRKNGAKNGAASSSRKGDPLKGGGCDTRTLPVEGDTGKPTGGSVASIRSGTTRLRTKAR